MTKGYVLTEEEIRVLQGMVREYLGNPKRPRSYRQEWDDGLAPEEHVALTPASGIAAISGNTPGSASCTIYKQVGGVLTAVSGYTKTVYNIHTAGVPHDTYVNVARDKFGDWYVLSSCSDQDADTGTGASVQPYFPPPPSICDPIYVDETDLRCEYFTTIPGIGTGTGTDVVNPASLYFLNLYQRRVYIGFDLDLGCLLKTEGPWQYVRTVGCCEPDCVEPNTGTSAIHTECLAENCCPHCLPRNFKGTLSDRVGYALNLPTTIYFNWDGTRWVGQTGNTTCGLGFNVFYIQCVDTGTEYRLKLTSLNSGLTAAAGELFTGVTPVVIVDPATGVQTATNYRCGNTAYRLTLNVTCPTQPDPIPSDCCPDDDVPAVLLVTFSNKTGVLACLPDSFEITYNPDTQKWENDPGSADWAPGCTGDGIGIGQFYIECVGGSWSCTNAASNPATSANCNPFELVWENETFNTFPAATVTMTITEAP